ncbi:MAG: prepilin-type N-terminal cleavage/methylation domain-containing protein [Candidatus Paceibacterota bacterium]|jgi:prepilin-type N-terminal cleavage/methylation domain-containing protein
MESIHLRRGFSLIELLVVFAIMTVITSAVLTSQSSFNKTLTLANTAYDVALSLRSAEGFGLGSRTAAGVSLGVGYGIHFDGTPTSSYTLFADKNAPNPAMCHHLPPSGDKDAPDAQYGNCEYDSGEKISDYTIGNGITISGLCSRKSFGACTPATSLDIVFVQPDPKAYMSADGAYSSAITSACITLTSAQGGSYYVSVTSAGGIMASATSCL